MMKLNFKLPPELDFIRAGRLAQKQSLEKLNGKICLITGTTSGVGYETALRFASGGAKLLMIVRNKDKAIALCNELKEFTEIEPVFYISDLSNLKNVHETIEIIVKDYPKIDILINNAGVHMTTRKLTIENNEMAFVINHLASFLITTQLANKLAYNAHSRIIQVNSEGHRFGGLQLNDLNWEKRKYNGYRGYGASKTAQLMTVWELADILKETGVTINALHPGAVKSNIGHNNGKLYNLYSKFIIQPMLKNPKIAAEAIYYLATSPEMKGVTGKFFNLTNEEIPAPHASDRNLGRKIFEISKKLTNTEI